MASERDEHAGSERVGAPQPTAAVDHDVVPLFQVLDYVLHEGLKILRLGLLKHAMSSIGKSKYLYAPDTVPLQELGDSVAVVLVLLLERSHVGRQVSPSGPVRSLLTYREGRSYRFARVFPSRRAL